MTPLLLFIKNYLKAGKKPEPGKNPEKVRKSGIFLENPEELATLFVKYLLIVATLSFACLYCFITH